jgi:adenosylcobinamide-GDP ribazoletransferase
MTAPADDSDIDPSARASKDPILFPFVLALSLLTRVPVPLWAAPKATDHARSICYHPIVGALIGVGIAGAGLLFLELGLVPALAAVLMVAVGLLLTGALHEDGLADSCDGLFGGWSRAGALRIMKDSRVGSFGAAGIAMALLIRATALMAIAPLVWPEALAVAHTLARASSAVLLGALPAASEQGLARAVKAALLRRHVVIALAVSALIVAFSSGARALPALIGAVLVTLVLGCWFRRRLGGVTGDCLGATAVVTELTVIISFAALSPARQSPWLH